MRKQTELEKAFKKAGFAIVRRNAHIVWRCPCGHRKVTTASSIGEGHGFKNAINEMTKTITVCKTLTREKAAA